MPFEGLREFIQLLDNEGELAHVRVPVDLNQELGAVCVKSLRARGPALLFERPGGKEIPIFINALATRKRYALAMQCKQEEIHREWNRRVSHPLPPALVETGPCQEIILQGDDVNILDLPAPTLNRDDGGPYLTLCCHITRDPTTDVRNVGIYRNQVHDRRTLGILSGPYTNFMLQQRKAGNDTFPVAIAIGVDPRLVMAASCPFPFGTDEMAMAGALRGKAFEVVQCKTVPLQVPADAEVVLEGYYRPDEKREEGPFGEFTGHYGGLKMPRPTIHLTALTRRKEPILHLAYQGAPPHETDVLTAIGKESEILRSISLAGVKAVHLTEGGCGVLHVVVSIEKLFEGYGKMVGLAIFGQPSGRHIKQVTVVDDDIDPTDPVAVEWAVATRVQPHRDIEIMDGLTGIFLDPSLPKEEQEGPARTSKMLVDATRYDAKNFAPVCLPARDVSAMVEKEWERYGIGKAGGRKPLT
ncbi:MAG TPA: UbiD family decarboxylase [Methylomirabilota bacterium]|nr:UbiD family decarboxylase [Methylomirabilota bacterium]